MAKQKKASLDSSKIKEYLATKGERVGLFAAVGLTVLLLLAGIMMVFSAHSQHKEVKQAASQLLQNVNSAAAPSEDPEKQKAKNGLPEWAQLSAGTYLTGPFFDDRTVLDEKLVNPFVLPLVGSLDTEEEREKYIKIDVVRAPVKVNKFTTGGDGVWVLSGPAAGAGAAPGSPGPGSPGPAGSSGSGMYGPGMPGSQVSTVPLVTSIELKRLVVVSAMFPYEKQLEIFQKALRKNSIQEVVMDPKISPKFLGLNVVRCEVEDGKPVNWTKLFFKDPETNIVKIDSDWKNFLKKAEFDHTTYQKVYQNVKQGLVTPLPQLAFGSYPKLDLPGIKIEENPVEPGMGGMPGSPGMPPMPGSPVPGKGSPAGGGLPGVGGMPKGGGMPGQPMGGGTTGTTVLKQKTLKEIAKLDKNLAKKLEGKFNAFDPFGMDVSTAPANSMYPGGVPGSPTLPMPPKSGTGPSKGEEQPPGTPPDGMPPDGMPSTPDTMGGQSIPEHLLVRFVDVDVQPGKTYKYFIQIRMANPNFGKDKKEKVAYPALAEIKELVSPWTETPSQEIEEEFRYYVIDQLDMLAGKGNIIHPVTKDTELKPIKNQPQDSIKNLKDFIPVQIHRWVKEALHPDTNKPESTGGWAIAERLLVKRGQYLGEIHRKKGTETRVEVQLPIWREDKGAGMFEILAPKSKPKVAQKVSVMEFKGVLVDMTPKKSAPMVIDFKGGESEYFPTYNRNTVGDKGAIEMLVLSPDGKLLAHNSREDSDPGSERGIERLERYQLWLNVIETLMKHKASGTGGEGGLPGAPGP